MHEHNSMIQLTSPRSGGEVFTKLLRIPGVQMIYVSALACTRHRSHDFIQMQRAGRLSFLMFNEVDMVTGDYIDKTKQAAAEIAAERNPSGIILLTGCQSALLSTDYKLLSAEIEAEIGCPVRVHDGCRLCGFDEEKGGSSAIDRMLYAFLNPAQKSEELSVNILGNQELDEGSELFAILSAAGVTKINRLADCNSFDEYQKMAKAHLNILTSPQDLDIGPHLEETLGIPYVCLGGIYSREELSAAYETLGKLLNTQIDVSAHQAKLTQTLSSAKDTVGGCPICVQGDVELAKWLLCEGFHVRELVMNPHQGLSPEQRIWFDEHASGLTVSDPKRGGHGKPGGHGRPADKSEGRGGRPEGRGGPGKSNTLKLGYLGALSALKQLEQKKEGRRQ